MYTEQYKDVFESEKQEFDLKITRIYAKLAEIDLKLDLLLTQPKKIELKSDQCEPCIITKKRKTASARKVLPSLAESVQTGSTQDSLDGVLSDSPTSKSGELL